MSAMRAESGQTRTDANDQTGHRPDEHSRTLWNSDGQRVHSSFILADLATMTHFSTSSASNFPKFPGVRGIGTPPSSAILDVIFGSTRAALMFELSFITT